MNRRPPATIAGLSLLGSLLIGPPSPASAASDAARDYRRAAVVATNNIRANHDRVRLAAGECLQRFARRHAARMAAAKDLWHQDLQRILDRCNLNFVGENVAAGYSSGRTAVRDGWMESPDHRKNILQPEFRRIAVAARAGDDGRWYACQLFGVRD